MEGMIAPVVNLFGDMMKMQHESAQNSRNRQSARDAQEFERENLRRFGRPGGVQPYFAPTDTQPFAGTMAAVSNFAERQAMNQQNEAAANKQREWVEAENQTRADAAKLASDDAYAKNVSLEQQRAQNQLMLQNQSDNAAAQRLKMQLDAQRGSMVPNTYERLLNEDAARELQFNQMPLLDRWYQRFTDFAFGRGDRRSEPVWNRNQQEIQNLMNQPGPGF